MAAPQQPGTPQADPPTQDPPAEPQHRTAFRGTATGESLAPDDPPEPEAEPDTGEGGTPPAETGERRTVGHGGEIPPERLKERLDRERRKWAREMFGTDDPEKIEALKKEREEKESELERLRKEEQRRTRARMSESQRMQKDIETKDARIADLEQQLRDKEDTILMKDQDRIIEGVLTKYIDDTMADDAKWRFARHVKSLDEKKLARFGEKQIEQWFEKLAQENPRFAREVPSAPADEKPETPQPTKKPAPRRVPVGSPAKKPAPRPASNSSASKTPRPGQPNSMDKKELRDHLRQQGIKPWT